MKRRLQVHSKATKAVEVVQNSSLSFDYASSNEDSDESNQPQEANSATSESVLKGDEELNKFLQEVHSINSNGSILEENLEKKATLNVKETFDLDFSTSSQRENIKERLDMLKNNIKPLNNFPQHINLQCLPAIMQVQFDPKKDQEKIEHIQRLSKKIEGILLKSTNEEFLSRLKKSKIEFDSRCYDWYCGMLREEYFMEIIYHWDSMVQKLEGEDLEVVMKLQRQTYNLSIEKPYSSKEAGLHQTYDTELENVANNRKIYTNDESYSNNVVSKPLKKKAKNQNMIFEKWNLKKEEIEMEEEKMFQQNFNDSSISNVKKLEAWAKKEAEENTTSNPNFVQPKSNWRDRQ